MELNEYWSAQAIEEYRGLLHEQNMRDYDYNCRRSAPHVIHNAEIKQDGNQWCCILGDFMTGVVGFGETPQRACDEFDRIWEYGR